MSTALAIMSAGCPNIITVAQVQARDTYKVITYGHITFEVPTSWTFVREKLAAPSCRDFRLLSPTSRSSDPRTAMEGATIAFMPYRAHADCVDMQTFFQGAWHLIKSEHGLPIAMSNWTSTVKYRGGVAVWDFAVIRSDNVAMQLFGYGSSIKAALRADRSILSTARTAN